jgi:hypothetical protein
MEGTVLDQWKEELSAKYKDALTGDDFAEIVRTLQLFTSKMFIRHGVESVAILYPDETKTQQWLESVSGSIVEDLPKTKSLRDAVVKLEVPSFFLSANPQRRLYITSLFNSSFFWHLVQVDEKLSKLLRSATKGQRLFLDNNILYSLVGLHGPAMLQSMHTMLRLASSLEYDLWVTTTTIDEFKASLHWHVTEMKRMPFIPHDLARIAAENLEANSFLTTYWVEFAKNRTTVEEFVAEKTHVEKILSGLQIRINDEYVRSIKTSAEFTEEKSILMTECKGVLNDNIVAHDAFHRVFIGKLRGTLKYSFSQAVAWFLTDDRKLPRYDRAARKGKQCLPFCVTTDQWIQINRPLLVRTANRAAYEESYHSLVTRPFLRTMTSTFSLERAYGEVLGRLARYKEMSPNLALTIAADKHFMVTMAMETDQAKFEGKLENKLVDVANELKKRTEVLERQVRTTASKLALTVSEATEIRTRLREANQKYHAEVEALKRTVDGEKKRATKAEEASSSLNGQLAAERTSSSVVKTELEQTRELHRSFKLDLGLWSMFSLISATLTALLWYHDIWFSFAWLDQNKNSLLMKVATQMLIVLASLNIPLRSHWKALLAPTIAVILALLTLARL